VDRLALVALYRVHRNRQSVVARRRRHAIDHRRPDGLAAGLHRGAHFAEFPRHFAFEK
jgi:hypothetical protein